MYFLLRILGTISTLGNSELLVVYKGIPSSMQPRNDLLMVLFGRSKLFFGS